jgi:thiamine pyrophosphate-dependent acetolactate synthase large subunit-like protein
MHDSRIVPVFQVLAEDLHALGLRAAIRKRPVAKSVFPDVDFASVAEAFGFQAYTIRTLDECGLSVRS